MKNGMSLVIAAVACFSLQQAAQAECPQLCGDKFNTAFGGALPGDTTGVENTAIGTEAMQLTQTGSQNTAIGAFALLGTNGSGNVAIGDKAIANTVKGDDNVAVGYASLSYVSGSHNIGIGTVAGVRLTYGSYNIDLENHGMPDDANTIRIGNGVHRRAFIAGISSVTVPNGVSVVINSDGQLGIMTSSARYKEAIKPMKDASESIFSLKPVTFRYKKELDPKATSQFGLVAEEVAKVDPDLVARDEQGKPYTVRYDEVNAMLLNEFLKEHRKVEAQGTQIGQLEATMAKLQAALEKQAAQLRKVNDRLEAAPPAPRLVEIR